MLKSIKLVFIWVLLCAADDHIFLVYHEFLNTCIWYCKSIIDKLFQVSPNVPKPKQKTQAKGFLQQKKKALADLFKALTTMGLSYKTGLVESQAKEGAIVNFVTPPVDLKASFTYLKNKWVYILSCARPLFFNVLRCSTLWMFYLLCLLI